MAADVARVARVVGAAAPDGDWDDDGDGIGCGDDGGGRDGGSGGSGGGDGWQCPSMRPRYLDDALAVLLRGVAALNAAATTGRQATAATVTVILALPRPAAPGDRAALDALTDDAHLTVGIPRLEAQGARAAAGVGALGAGASAGGGGAAASGDGGCAGWRVDSAVAAGVDLGVPLADAAAKMVTPCVQNGDSPDVWATTHGGGSGGGGDPSMLSARGSSGAPPVVVAAVLATDVHYAGVELIYDAASALFGPHGSSLPDVVDRDVAAATVAVDVYLRLPTAEPRACR